MRIALVHHSLRRGGGMERYLLDLIAGLAAAGDAVDVHCRQADPGLAASLPARVHVLPVPRWPRAFASTRFARRVPVSALKASHDGVLTLSRVPDCTAYICGGTHPGYLSATGRRGGLHDRLETRLERRTACSARLNIAHSARLARELAEHYGVGRATATLYPPVDARLFPFPSDAQRRAARERFGIPRGQKVFLFPSMDHRRKGLDLLLAASGRLRVPHRILIAGRPPQGFPPSSHSRFLGYVDDMPALYSAVDATVLPSRYEPFGLVIAESLACGTPVIVSGDAGVAELVDRDHGILLPGLSADSVLDALQEACERRFAVAPGFVATHGLDPNEHVARMKALLVAAI